MDVVGADQGNVQLLCQFVQHGVGLLLFGQAMVLHLQVVPVSEDVLEPECALLCHLILVVHQKLEDFTCQTGRETDEVLTVALQHLVIDPGLVVVTFRECDRVELHEMVVAPVIHCQQDKVIVSVALGGGSLVLPVPGVHVELAADDGLDACSLACLVKAQCTVHVSMVGDGKGLHALCLCLLHVLRYWGCSVEK